VSNLSDKVVSFQVMHALRVSALDASIFCATCIQLLNIKKGIKLITQKNEVVTMISIMTLVVLPKVHSILHYLRWPKVISYEHHQTHARTPNTTLTLTPRHRQQNSLLVGV
jgi:hypothetical protein